MYPDYMIQVFSSESVCVWLIVDLVHKVSSVVANLSIECAFRG